MLTKEYPEHDKLELVREKSQVCAEFLEWLLFIKGIDLATRQGPSGFENLRHVDTPRDELIAEFFNIDKKKLAFEKGEILDEIKKKTASIYSRRERE